MQGIDKVHAQTCGPAALEPGHFTGDAHHRHRVRTGSKGIGLNGQEGSRQRCGSAAHPRDARHHRATIAQHTALLATDDDILGAADDDGVAEGQQTRRRVGHLQGFVETVDAFGASGGTGQGGRRLVDSRGENSGLRAILRLIAVYSCLNGMIHGKLPP